MTLSSLPALLLAIAAPLYAQSSADRGMTLPGTLELVDKLNGARVEGISVSIHQLNGNHEVFRAVADRDGKFTLENVLPDRYSLEVHFPGRIQVFTLESKSLVPVILKLQRGRPARL